MFLIWHISDKCRMYMLNHACDMIRLHSWNWFRTWWKVEETQVCGRLSTKSTVTWGWLVTHCAEYELVQSAMDCLKPMTRAPTRAEIDIFLQDCDSFVILVNTLRGTTLSDVAINLTICFRAIHKLTYVQPACGVAYINLTIFVALFVDVLCWLRFPCCLFSYLLLIRIATEAWRMLLLQ